jgi:dihydropyrimidinase
VTTLIKNGTIVTAGDTTRADLLVEGDKISKIGVKLTDKADSVVDARGHYVIPGGIDVHTHLDMPFGGTVSNDDFKTGHIAAAFGGTTSHIDFCIQSKGQSFADALETWHGKARDKAGVDYGFHVAITDLNDRAMRELPSLPEQGVSSIKLFMAYKGTLMVDDETLFRAMQVAAGSGVLTMVHAENGDVIDVLVRDALAGGHTEPVWHARTRPHLAEAEATGRAVALAGMADAALYVVHMTCASAVEQLRLGQWKGLNVHGETCTQYFFMTERDLARPGFEGAKYVCSPPMRTKADGEALWEAVADGTLEIVSTDHCVFNMKGQKDLGRDDFSKIPNGVPGIEDRMMMLYDQGVRKGRLTLNRWVELTATNPAKRFGLYPYKGTVAVGADADLVLWNPKGKKTISAETHHMNVDYNLYEGRTVTGLPAKVWSRGELIVDEGAWLGEAGRGQFLHRDKVY